MDAAYDLLSAALDNSGWMFIVGLGSTTIQTPIPPGDYHAAVAEAQRLDARGLDVYFATSTFKNNQTRKAHNAQAVKVIKLDFDVGDSPEKYNSKAEVRDALAQFCSNTGMPAPTAVMSGYGIHAYWILEDALTDLQGALYATKFKQLCAAHGLKTDPTVTADIARILRVPGTHNYKKPDAPKEVKVILPVAVHANAPLLELIDKLHSECAHLSDVEGDVLSLSLPAHLRGIELDPLTKSLFAEKPKKFSIILDKSTAGQGCAQIKDIYEHQKDQEEGRWRAGVSIAHFCDDGEQAIHIISDKHPEYTRAATIKKAEGIKGPYTCAYFRQSWPALCEGCQLKITSPILLGNYVPLAQPSDNIVMDQNRQIEDAPRAYEIPEYPWPFVRGKNGGVFREDEGADPVLVSKVDFYMQERLQSKDTGYMGHMRMHTPKDGVVDFMLEAREAAALEKLRDALALRGLVVYDKKLVMMRDYVKTWFDTLALKEEAKMVKTQFGWTEGFKSFVIGNREIFAYSSAAFSHAAPSLQDMIPKFSKSGSLEDWKKVWDAYRLPGTEAHLFCALVGFGAPLLALVRSPLVGALVNAYSQKSGSGKSTCLQAALSIWGNPAPGGLMMNFDDTPASRYHRMGVYKNMPICIDELTQVGDDAIGALLFSVTQGRSRERMMASVNQTRRNDSTWVTLALTSGNTSFVERLQANQSGVEGQLMRMLEPNLVRPSCLSKIEADEIFNKLESNYGHAGDIFIQHVLQNMDRVKEMLVQTQRRIDRELNMQGEERYWSVILSCIHVGAELAMETDLINIDMTVLRTYSAKLIETMRSRLVFSSFVEKQGNDTLGEFINTHRQNMLVVDTGDEGKKVRVLQENTSQSLLMRYEKNAELVYIAQSELRKFLSAKNIHLAQFLEDAKKDGTYIDAGQKRLGAGTNNPPTNVRVYIFRLQE